MYQFNKNMKWEVLCFEGSCFTVAIAKTILQRSRGLMFVEELRKNQGMFFIFKTKLFPKLFWMKNVLIPLDIILLDEKLIVVDIKKNIEPCKGIFCPIIFSNKGAKYALEVNGGTADKMAIEPGSEANITLS